MDSRRRRGIAAILTLTLLVVGCGADVAIDDEPGVVDPPAAGGGDAPIVPVAAPGEFDVPGTVPMAGTLVAEGDDCWRLRTEMDGALLVLPPGTQRGASDDELRTSDGDVVASGTAIEVSGALLATDQLPGGPDGAWAGHVERCAPQHQAVVVAQTLRPVEPSIDASDAAALTARIEAATLDTHWPCGYGFAVSDAAQGVGVFVTPRTLEPPEPGTVTLPDDRFEVTVAVGRHLFVNHCDDVLEWFEPEAERFVTWPVTSGRFAYDPGAADGRCTGGAPVTSQLADAVVTTTAGSITLPPITLVNDAFGCFAG